MADSQKKAVLDEVISVAGDSTPNAPETVKEEDPEKALRDEALFRSLEKKKKKKKRRVIRTVIIILLILLIGGFFGFTFLRRKVIQSTVSNAGEVLSYDATKGSISTTVSGSGTLANVGEETISVPAGVNIEEVLVEANEKVEAGDVLAELDMPSVRTTMASVQSEIEEIDAEINEAADDTVDTYITAGVRGRVKAVYANAGDSVLDCMYKNGCLAIISLGGNMALELETDRLSAGDQVTVVRGDGSEKELTGSVEKVINGTALILVTDNGPEIDETVTVKTEDGAEIGKAKLYVYKELKVTGINGTIGTVAAQVNHAVEKGSCLFILSNTEYSASYEALIKQRKEKQDLLLELMQLNKDGALLAPFSGSVGSVLYTDEESSSTGTTTTSSTTSTVSSTVSGTMTGAEGEETDVVTLSPDELMEVSISVDESNILSLEVGQTATITVSSIGDESYSGLVTEINKTATSSSGVTRYSANISLKKSEQMIPGMRAKVVVRIQGVDDAIIIPVDALHQTSSTSYVYTSYDEEIGEYGGLVKVEAGISNSSYVEIVSGLNEGDTVYYVEAEDNSFGGFGGFGGGMPDFSGGMPSGGGMGGGMPSGMPSGGGMGGGMPGGFGR
ncbi:MAG: HlyD family efflux transporter periplasmic adaptor subunit [Eubacteriales bacterium]|nr:HlyD family efflux transporter periplasmic adaptor subunit [Eubacteriales bacterium]